MRRFLFMASQSIYLDFVLCYMLLMYYQQSWKRDGGFSYHVNLFLIHFLNKLNARTCWM